MRRSKVTEESVTAVIAVTDLLPIGVESAPVVRAGNVLGTVEKLLEVYGRPIQVASDFVYIVTDDEEVPVSGDPYSVIGAAVVTTKLLAVEPGLFVCPNEIGFVRNWQEERLTINFATLGEVELHVQDGIKRLWEQRESLPTIAEDEPAVIEPVSVW